MHYLRGYNKVDFIATSPLDRSKSPKKAKPEPVPKAEIKKIRDLYIKPKNNTNRTQIIKKTH